MCHLGSLRPSCSLGLRVNAGQPHARTLRRILLHGSSEPVKSSCGDSPVAGVHGACPIEGGKAVLVISQFSHNPPVSLNNMNTAKNPKLTQVEHTCSWRSWAAPQPRRTGRRREERGRERSQEFGNQQSQFRSSTLPRVKAAPVFVRNAHNNFATRIN